MKTKINKINHLLIKSLSTLLVGENENIFFQPYQIWYLKETEDFEFEDDYLDEDRRRERLENILKLSLTKYWIDSLIFVSQAASNIHGSAKLPFMVTDGRILFVTHFPITYQRSSTQINEALDMLLNLKKRNNLDLPLELTMAADDVEQFWNKQYGQDPDSLYQRLVKTITISST